MEELTIPLRTYLDDKFNENKIDHNEMRDTFKISIEDHEKRLKALENWKLVFVAKFSVYSAIALIIGSAISQIGISLLPKFIK